MPNKRYLISVVHAGIKLTSLSICQDIGLAKTQGNPPMLSGATQCACTAELGSDRKVGKIEARVTPVGTRVLFKWSQCLQVYSIFTEF